MAVGGGARSCAKVGGRNLGLGKKGQSNQYHRCSDTHQDLQRRTSASPVLLIMAEGHWLVNQSGRANERKRPNPVGRPRRRLRTAGGPLLDAAVRRIPGRR